MPETTQFTIGSEARCSDGICGEVSRVIIDPLAQAVTHLVVEPAHGEGPDRLVPLVLVDATTDELRIRCTTAELDTLEPAEETRFLQGGDGYGGYGPGHALVWPYYSLGMGGMGMGGVDLGELDDVAQAVTTDTVPLGEVDVRRGDRVHCSDGDVGRVQGLVIDSESHRVTHVLLQEGHLWGRKEVAIPIGAVADVTDGIRLNLTKQQVEGLPPLNVHHPDR